MRGLIGGLLGLLLAACDSPVSPPVLNLQELVRDELVVAIRESPTTYSLDADQQAVGFEYELLSEFAREQHLALKLAVLPSDDEMYRHLETGKAQFAVGWLSAPPSAAAKFRLTRPYFRSRMAVVQHEAALPIDTPEELAAQPIHVAAGSHLAERLYELRQKLPQLTIVERPDPGGLDLLRAVAEQKIELAVTDAPIFDIAQNYFPELQSPTLLGEALPISWLFPAAGDAELFAMAEAFLARIERDGTLERLKDRYFGHVRRLDSSATFEYLERLRSVLPKFQALFKQAQVRSGIDWRLLAALAYQESKWDPLATSPTKVRGIMMLTEDTADALGVSDRLDPKQSIPAGAEYLAELREQLPPTLKEPDRTWLALAAYNLGMGHLNGGRAIATSMNADPNVWYEMKRILPLMARPEYYSRLKSGRARGGEAVIMVENIRAFYDILKREVPAYDPLPKIEPEKVADKVPPKPRTKPRSFAEAFRRATEGPGLKLPRPQRPGAMSSTPAM